MAQLAEHWYAAGCRVTMLTARWDARWPEELNFNGVRVLRFPQPRRRVWGNWRYMRAISGWLRDHAKDFDLCYVSMLRHDAYAATTTARRRGFPVVVRAKGIGSQGDIQWQDEASFGHRIRRRTRQANCIIAPSREVFSELISGGYPADGIVHIPNAVAIPDDAQLLPKLTARQGFAHVQAELQMPADGKLAVFTGPLEPHKRLNLLIDAWPILLRRFPYAFLWLVGDGTQREELFQLIQRRGLADRVFVVGPVEMIEDILSAADAFVLPSPEEGISLSLLEAMAHGLPVVAANIPGNREVIRHKQNGWLFKSGEAQALADGLIRIWEEPSLVQKFSHQATQTVRQRHQIQQVAGAHLDLFHQLLAASRSQPASQESA